MNTNVKLALLFGLPLIGIAAGFFLMGRELTITVNGAQEQVFTYALTVRGALRSAGLKLTPQDRVSPPARTWLSRTTEIEIDQSRRVRIWIDPQGELLEVTSAARLPVELLREAGLLPSPEDAVMVDGESVGLEEELATLESLTLQYIPVIEINITDKDQQITTLSTVDTLGMALWKDGYRLTGSEATGLDLLQQPQTGMEVVIPRSRSIEISVDGVTLKTVTSLATIGEALGQSGVVLQDLDYAVPAERQPIPDDGKIKVVRVSEELVFEQTSIPYEVQSSPDDSLDITQKEVLQEGKTGVKASRVRVRYEDGVEISRTSESDIVLVNPEPRIEKYGTRMVENVISTPEGNFTYYLAVEVTATAYSPCRLGVEGLCGYTTASGLPLQKGVIGVHRAWFNIFRGTLMYVPGYGVGTIADVGVYPYDSNWVDLGYSDDDFVGWGAIPVTVYFLSPAPPGFTGVLP